MGTDYHAITVIGMPIPRKNLCVLKNKTIKYENCKCELNNCKFNYCPECGKINNKPDKIIENTKLHPDIKLAYPSVPTTVYELGYEDKLFKYLLYDDLGEDDDNIILYVTLYIGEKDGPRCFNKNQIVKCPFSLLDLEEKRKELKTYLLTKKFVTEDYFDEHFGIYTLIQWG